MYKFLGIGAQKAGTTWLFRMLSQHPNIAFPHGKEIHYWNRQYPKHPPEDYLSKFISNTLAEGEITPAYAFLPLETIKQIHHHAPDLRIIYIIRNPIDRAWSSARMALVRAEMTFTEASDQWFIDHFNSQGSLLRGDYERSISNWTQVFNSDNLLILSFEDIHQSPQSLLEKCCQHIGVPNFSNKTLQVINPEKKVFSGSSNTLNPVLQEHLKALYKDKIQSLSTTLNRDLSHWL